MKVFEIAYLVNLEDKALDRQYRDRFPFRTGFFFRFPCHNVSFLLPHNMRSHVMTDKDVPLINKCGCAQYSAGNHHKNPGKIQKKILKDLWENL